MGSIMHFALAVIASFVGLALLLAVFYACAFLVFGTYAVLLGIHPALGWAYVVGLWAVFLGVVIGRRYKNA